MAAERWQLAEINVGRMRFPLEDPRMAAFRDASPVIDLLAENSAGFVSRSRSIGATIRGIASAPETPLVVNVSCWTDYASLHAFTYPGAHGRYLSARARWFLPVEGRTTALWWHPQGDPPALEHAIARLLHLREHGITDRAFTVLRRFPPPR